MTFFFTNFNQYNVKLLSQKNKTREIKFGENKKIRRQIYYKYCNDILLTGSCTPHKEILKSGKLKILGDRLILNSSFSLYQ